MPTISRTPICSNALSPWPRIQFSDRDPRLFDAAQGNASLAKKANLKALSRNRVLSEASFGSKVASQDRRVTFSSAPQQVSNIDIRNASNVEQSTNAREAILRYDPPAEQSAQASSRAAIPESDLVRQISVPTRNQDTTRPQQRSDLRHERRSVINQGHTAELCWHMRLQAADGILIPPEFGGCTIHPTLDDQRPQTPTTPAFEDGFETPKSYSKHTSLTSTTGSTTGSSTWVDSEISALNSPTWKTSEGTLKLVNAEEIEGEEDEEADPFLHLGRQLLDQKFKSSPSDQIRRSSNCTCSHRCLTYLSYTPSAHCNSCRLPTPQPEILSAKSRLKAAERKNLIDDGEEWVGIGEGKLKALRKDSELVERYEREMEKRCEKGIWWEGWIVVRELQNGGR